MTDAAATSVAVLRLLRPDGLSVCRGCGAVFPIPLAAAGHYCSRDCYTDRQRPNRRRRPRTIPLVGFTLLQ